VNLVRGDFYTADLGGGFDCVTYWNGFGVGTDADQRRLLRRVSGTWLAPGGSMVLDVFSPWRWAREAGTVRRVNHAVALINAIPYDPVSSRLVDTWWPAGGQVCGRHPVRPLLRADGPGAVGRGNRAAPRPGCTRRRPSARPSAQLRPGRRR